MAEKWHTLNLTLNFKFHPRSNTACLFLFHQPPLASCYLNKPDHANPCKSGKRLRTATDGRSLPLFLGGILQFLANKHPHVCIAFSGKNPLWDDLSVHEWQHSPHSSASDESRYSGVRRNVLLLPGPGPTGFESEPAEDRKLTGLHWLGLPGALQTHKEERACRTRSTGGAMEKNNKLLNP